MNLTKLFQMQKALDDKIQANKNFVNQDVLTFRVLALFTELGELANEWRYFKFWSEDRSPRRVAMIMEYVDCLHFILSIGLTLKVEDEFLCGQEFGEMDAERAFILTYDAVARLYAAPYTKNYWDMFDIFMHLGHLLDISPDTMEEAYTTKNQINQVRQETGY